MRRLDARLIWGILLIGGGIFYLLQNFGYLRVSGLIWGVVFGLGGIAFLWVFFRDRGQGWAIIPALTLLGLAALITLDQTAPSLADAWGGALFLGSIGLGFWVVYLVNRGHWWAIIPGGVLLTVAAVAGLESALGEFATGGVFFLGLGVTFGLVALAPAPQGRMKWAYIPAGALLLFGLLLTVGFGDAINYLGPVALILGGIFLLARAVRRRA